MTSFGEIASHLTGLINPLSPSFARDIVNQAREDLYAEKEWSFLWSEGYIRVPTLITGIASFNKYSTSVVVNTALKAKLDLLGIDDIPIIGRQIKVINFENEYTITNWDSTTSTIILDEMYLGDSNANANVEIYQRFFLPPEYVKPDGNRVIDFARFEAVVDVKNRYQLDISSSNSIISSYDSTRISAGNAYALIAHKENSNGIVTYELYPVIKQNIDKIYKVLYIRQGYNFIDDDELFPKVFSKSLLIAAAEISAYKWCMINKATYPSLQKTNFENLIALVMARNNPKGYSMQLDKALKRDEELFPQSLLSSYSSYPMNPLSLCEGEYYGMNETLVNAHGVMNFKF